MSRSIRHAPAPAGGAGGDKGNSEILNKNLRDSVSLWRNRLLIWLLPVSFLTIAFFYPLSRILSLTFDLRALSAENLLSTFHVLRFTFYQAALSTLLTLLA